MEKCIWNGLRKSTDQNYHQATMDLIGFFRILPRNSNCNHGPAIPDRQKAAAIFCEISDIFTKRVLGVSHGNFAIFDDKKEPDFLSKIKSITAEIYLPDLPFRTSPLEC